MDNLDKLNNLNVYDYLTDEEKIQMAFREIEIQKKAAIVEVKNSVGLMALEIAEKVIRKELKSNNEQVEYVNKLAKESNLN